MTSLEGDGEPDGLGLVGIEGEDSVVLYYRMDEPVEEQVCVLCGHHGSIGKLHSRFFQVR